jgi:hypothetical protein
MGFGVLKVPPAVVVLPYKEQSRGTYCPTPQSLNLKDQCGERNLGCGRAPPQPDRTLARLKSNSSPTRRGKGKRLGLGDHMSR